MQPDQRLLSCKRLCLIPSGPWDILPVALGACLDAPYGASATGFSMSGFFSAFSTICSVARQAELSSLLLEVCNLPVSLLREQNSECANMTRATVTSCPVSVLKADVIEPNKALSWLGVTFVQQQAQQKTNSLVLGVTHLWRWWECDNLSTNEITERVML